MANRTQAERDAGQALVGGAIILSRCIGFGFRLGHADQFATTGKLVLTIAVAAQAVITDPLETAGQDMDKEAADEFVSTQCHRFLFSMLAIILLEANLAVLDI